MGLGNTVQESKYDIYWWYVKKRLEAPSVSHGIIMGGECGFFGNLFMTLNGIRACEIAKATPHPLWSHNCLYWDKKYGSNAWDYFFEPFEELDRSAEGGHRGWAFKPLATYIHPCYEAMDVQSSYAEIIRRYLKVHNDIAERVDSFASHHFGKQEPLGCHMRFTDVSAEYGRAVSLEKYWEAIDFYLDNNECDKFFVATDDQEALKATQNRYQGRVAFQADCIRSCDGRSIHGHYDSGIAASGYQKGLDVLTDALLLARCRHLIGISSTITRFSACVNERQTQEVLGGHSLW
ncbi:O-fucosyltransferase family protein [Pontiella sulfatireligans]|uniref:Uncharacterized protein n=1 Tax=Pontiella sulfatireligans TaxID=2750658 RepID=A0A6C2UN34_9BACT|nr:hypothetical protein [Pontiella sulfatireligans]VGO21672.1 hypothetical protein SCARR_03746 [Pontiella sulfatireligans]